MPGASTAGATGAGVAAGEVGADAAAGGDVVAALAGAPRDEDALAAEGGLTDALTGGGRC
jgi:hypothetical protein